MTVAGKPFCCLGCQTVFSLLQENGLGQFYDLNVAPGTRMTGAATAAKWVFLDDPAVRAQLLDFADDRQARVTLQLPAIHCVACVWLLENLFRLHPGVGQSLVNFSRREAAITFAPDQIKLSELAALLAAIGYEPQFTLGATEKVQPSPLGKRMWLQIGLAGFAFGNIMIMSLPFYLGLDSFNGPWFKSLAGWLGLALALPVVMYSAADFWRAAWVSVRQRVLTLEVPIALGLAAIYAASVFEVWSQHGPGYCDTLCALIFFLLCGRGFQRKTYDRLAFDRDYKEFFPLAVMRKTAAGEESVAISRINTGDCLRLRHGELLPADARLIGGTACIDYSFVTGESEPVKCPIGERLYAGGRQVGGVIEVETLKPVAQSYLATLWNHEAFRKPRDHELGSLTNRYSRYFTKLVVGVALGAAGFWWFRQPDMAMKAFISVLIIACPCALALAAPLTHGTAQRLLARRNIFLKNALVVERLAKVDTVVLDKTGTLTCADARGVEFIPVTHLVTDSAGRASARADILAGPDKPPTARADARPGQLPPAEARWIYSLACSSTHPNSLRVAKFLGGEPLPVNGFKETPGMGIEGEIEGHLLRLGSGSWITTAVRGDACPPNNSSNSGSTVAVAIDGAWRGEFRLENSLRPEVEQLITQLGNRFALALLSGDNERAAALFRKMFGDHAILKFNQSPADKLNFIRDLQQRGRRVMMVGDGLNDAGALKQAEVGVAVVEQIGAFSPASDVILDAAELPQLARVLQFSRQAARIVRLGFVISAAYNLVGVSIAAAGWLSPIVCAILMPLSSATVVAFTCGATVWLGRGLKAGRGLVDGTQRRRRQLSALELQALPKEVA